MFILNGLKLLNIQRKKNFTLVEPLPLVENISRSQRQKLSVAACLKDKWMTTSSMVSIHSEGTANSVIRYLLT